jgi:hypothetical protein
MQVNGQLHATAALPTRKTQPVHAEERAGRASETFRTPRQKGKFLAPIRIRTSVPNTLPRTGPHYRSTVLIVAYLLFPRQS